MYATGRRGRRRRRGEGGGPTSHHPPSSPCPSSGPLQAPDRARNQAARALCAGEARPVGGSGSCCLRSRRCVRLPHASPTTSLSPLLPSPPRSPPHPARHPRQRHLWPGHPGSRHLRPRRPGRRHQAAAPRRLCERRRSTHARTHALPLSLRCATPPAPPPPHTHTAPPPPPLPLPAHRSKSTGGM